MANFKYDGYRGAALRAEVDWLDDDIKSALINTDLYTASKADDDFLSDIPSAAITAVSGLMDTSASGPAANAADTVFPDFTGARSRAVVVFKSTGVAGTSRLIAYVDSATRTSVDVSATGNDVTVKWPATGIFSL